MHASNVTHQSNIGYVMKLLPLLLAVSAIDSMSAMPAAQAQDYPNRPVRLLVGLGPGGGSDTVARIMTTKLTDMLGQSFVVDNRPSAGGAISSEIVAKAAPDGYTLLAMSPTHVITPSLRSNAGYDPIRDFAPIILTVYTPYVLSVRNSVAAANIRELIALAKTQRLTYASSGIGGSNHLTGELFRYMAGIEMIHVPYKSGAQANSALIAGEVHMSFTAIGGLVSHIKAGRVRALGVTSSKRAAATPEIPTIAESGVPGFEVIGWYGLGATAKTPQAIISKLNAAANRALPELKERYANIGTEIAGGTAADFAAYIKIEFEKWAKVVKISGAKAE
jgi:tripartite-type tricarboxylate transporter receptor subunit TctC